jgi:peptidoglycan/xylan/chitin deacetylase (PgdA/CDA1 family)
MGAKRPHIYKLLLPQLVWDIKTNEKQIFLTFDDGPHPDITPQVMDILESYNAKATFFCVGENVEKHAGVYKSLLRNRHRTGNHTYNHLNGWNTPSEAYYENIEKCSRLVDSSLFRPPYGKIAVRHIPYLKMKFRIIMWSVLSMDFSKKVVPERCLRNTLKHTKAGSIVVFHDSEKAAENMLYALPRFLDHFSGKGFTFAVL